jgi:glucans biosynthesis protein
MLQSPQQCVNEGLVGAPGLIAIIPPPIGVPRRGAIENLEINPMGDRSLDHGGPRSRCGAKTRAGTACQSPPVAGRKRCRLHGGLSPGAPRGSRNGNYRRGDWTKEAIEERRWLRSLVQAFAKTGTGQ